MSLHAIIINEKINISKNINYSLYIFIFKKKLIYSNQIISRISKKKLKKHI